MPCSERRVCWPSHLSLCECCADGDSCSTQAPRGTSNSHATRVCQRILFTSLLPVAHYSRQYAHGNKHEKQTPKAWVRWFHIFLFFEAATRTAYFILEGVVPWKPPGKEDPRILLWEATLLWVATPCLFCCYIVVLGKWLGFLREISSQSNPASTRLSVNGVQGKKSKSFNWTACISVVIFVAYVATLALAYFAIFGASSDLQHKLYDIANSITDYVWEHLHNGTTFYLFCQSAKTDNRSDLFGIGDWLRFLCDADSKRIPLQYNDGSSSLVGFTESRIALCSAECVLHTASGSHGGDGKGLEPLGPRMGHFPILHSH